MNYSGVGSYKCVCLAFLVHMLFSGDRIIHVLRHSGRIIMASCATDIMTDDLLDIYDSMSDEFVTNNINI